jgi:hypothetical protein
MNIVGIYCNEASVGSWPIVAILTLEPIVQIGKNGAAWEAPFQKRILFRKQREKHTFYPYRITHFTYVEHIDQFYKDIGLL